MPADSRRTYLASASRKGVEKPRQERYKRSGRAGEHRGRTEPVIDPALASR